MGWIWGGGVQRDRIAEAWGPLLSAPHTWALCLWISLGPGPAPSSVASRGVSLSLWWGPSVWGPSQAALQSLPLPPCKSLSFADTEPGGGGGALSTQEGAHTPSVAALTLQRSTEDATGLVAIPWPASCAQMWWMGIPVCLQGALRWVLPLRGACSTRCLTICLHMVSPSCASHPSGLAPV